MSLAVWRNTEDMLSSKRLCLCPTILDSIKWNNYPPSPQSNDEGVKEQKRAILASLKWGEGWSRCSIYFVQDCIQGFNVTRQREPVIRNSYVNTFNGNTRKWCMSQSCASELKGNADNLSLGTTGYYKCILVKMNM